MAKDAQFNTMNTNIRRTLESFYPSQTPEEVLKTYEEKMEQDLVKNLFPCLNIQASIKSDKKSLPYQHEVVFCLNCESYVQGMFEYRKGFRSITRELLDKNAFKIRFYVEIDTVDTSFFNLGAVRYKFRYYIH